VLGQESDPSAQGGSETRPLPDALSTLAETHAEPELLDHLALYRESEEQMFWHDAFANVLLVSRSVPERVVAAFAADLGLTYSGGSAG
jgi:hypothetical protein